MTNKYQQSIEDIVDSMFEVTENDQDFANEVLNDFNSEYQDYLKKGADAINALVGSVKLKYGEQQHLKTNILIDKIKQLSKEKFIELVEKYTPDNKQVALFYRKLHESDSDELLKKDEALVTIINQLDKEGMIDDLLDSDAQ